MAVAALAVAALGGRLQPDRSSAEPSSRSFFALEFAAKYSELPAYTGVDFADGLQEEQAAASAEGSSSGRYVNVVDGRRATLPPPVCDCRSASLWLLGGSAAWGEGQRDEHTIASELVRLAEGDGISLTVENMGRRGATSGEELESFRSALLSEPPPQVVVFYHGWNDVLMAVANEFLRGSDAARTARSVSMEDVVAVNDDIDRFLEHDGGEAAGRIMAERHREMQREATELALQHGATPTFFFQPDAFASPGQLTSYERISGLSPQALLDSPFADALRSASEQLDGEVVNLRDLFDDSSESVFLGMVHQNEAGARVVAQRIYQDARPALLGSSG